LGPLGIDRSEIFRDAVHRHLVVLNGEAMRSGRRTSPVLVLTRDPVVDRVGSVVVAALTWTRRGLVSELLLTTEHDGVPTDCVVSFDNVHTPPRATFHNATPGRDCHDIVAGVRTGRH
jgi:mRNA-degrading endonuclease toxin of MazEF toxin-antitoxin module